MVKNVITTSKFHILLINGPNMNLLGKRDPKNYGYITLSNIILDLDKLARKLGLKLSHFQSNSEQDIINLIHKSQCNTDLIIINPAALAHTSISLRDAFIAVEIPLIEVHISNIYKREHFRRHSYLSDISIGVICGFGSEGYRFALEMAIKYLTKSN